MTTAVVAAFLLIGCSGKYLCDNCGKRTANAYVDFLDDSVIYCKDCASEYYDNFLVEQYNVKNYNITSKTSKEKDKDAEYSTRESSEKELEKEAAPTFPEAHNGSVPIADDSSVNQFILTGDIETILQRICSSLGFKATEFTDDIVCDCLLTDPKTGEAVNPDSKGFQTIEFKGMNDDIIVSPQFNVEESELIVHTSFCLYDGDSVYYDSNISCRVGLIDETEVEDTLADSCVFPCGPTPGDTTIPILHPDSVYTLFVAVPDLPENFTISGHVHIYRAKEYKDW